jgi:hypothetical protein
MVFLPTDGGVGEDAVAKRAARYAFEIIKPGAAGSRLSLTMEDFDARRI